MKSANKSIVALAVVLALLMALPVAEAVCPANGVTPLTVGPQNPQNGFPAWFQDTNGLAVELCLDPNFCFFDPPDPFNPFSVQVGFGPEAFWWSADAGIDNPAQGFSALLVLAVEAAWANEVPVPGDQFPFTRLRIRVDVPAPGTYTITHPYGQEVFNVTAIGAGNEINISRDIQVIGFNTTHNGSVGPLLVAVNPPPPPGFLGNVNIDQTVTGSPCGTNFFRIQPPAGVNIGAGAGNAVTTDLFAVQGKIFTGLLGTPLTVTRSTYARTNPGAVSVFANSAPTATLTVAGGPNFPATPVPMTGDGTGRFFAHVDIADSTTLPAFVTVTATNPGNSPTSINSNLVDVVNVTRADHATGILTIEATSSDQAVPPTLTAVGFGTLTAGSLAVPVAVPPAFVLVQSSAGGSGTRLVNVISAPPPPPPPPPTFSISGTITSGGNPLAGVTVNLAGDATALTTTNASGVYTFTGLPNGNYTVTPSLAGFTFTPASRNVTINGANVGGQDFAGAALPTFSISGSVTTSTGIPLPGVTMTLSGAANMTTTTNISGAYSFSGLSNGNYTVTPSRTGFSFTPSSRNVTINGSNVAGQNFVGARVR